MQETDGKKIKLLYLCTGNSCRSQMAEGWTRHLRGELIDACSAGIETHGLNPHAVKVMAEAGVDITNQRSQHIREFEACPLDVVITVCSHAHESCPAFPGRTRVIHARSMTHMDRRTTPVTMALIAINVGIYLLVFGALFSWTRKDYVRPVREGQLPLARPTILVGVNQTTMMALAMVVVASMIGAKGLGLEVLLAINRIEVGRGFEAGLCIVFMAIVIDRITFAMASVKKK